MTIYRNFDNVEGSFAACVGFFDGVHRGHQYLLHHLKASAKEAGLQSAVVTFANHPRKVVQPGFDLELIDTFDQRLKKLEFMGIDACFVIDFTEEVRRLTACEFICNVLSKKMHIVQLLIGYDHRFGHNREEGFVDYVRYGSECGMEVLQEPVFNDGSGLQYSSSKVRRALKSGDTELARQLLGWD